MASNDKASKLLGLHRSTELLTVVNVWDVISAKVVADIPGTKAKIHTLSSLASATPTTDGEAVYIPFWNGKDVILTAYNFKGDKLWDRNLGEFISQVPAKERWAVDRVAYDENDAARAGAKVVVADIMDGDRPQGHRRGRSRRQHRRSDEAAGRGCRAGGGDHEGGSGGRRP